MLKWNSFLSRFRQDLKGPDFLKNLLSKYMLEDNPIFYFTMAPSDSFGDALTEEEKDRLSQKIKDLSEHDKRDIYKLGLKLLEKQEETEDLSCLPTLHAKDIPLEVDSVELKHAKLSEDVAVQWRIAPTNGLTYFKSLISLHDLPQDLHPYLPLFSDALTSLGTKTQSMAELEDQIKLSTGGIDADIQIRCDPTDIDNWKLFFVILELLLGQQCA